MEGLTADVSAISVADNYACVLTTGGGVKCWGDNSHGQLGDGTTVDRPIPVDVSGLTSGVMAISAGGGSYTSYHTCALTTTGGVKCWGDNGNGKLGDGTTTDRLIPVDVRGLAYGVTSIAAGSYHSCALSDAGGIKCWGFNGYGQLGDGTTIGHAIPEEVRDFPELFTPTPTWTPWPTPTITVTPSPTPTYTPTPTVTPTPTPTPSPTLTPTPTATPGPVDAWTQASTVAVAPDAIVRVPVSYGNRGPARARSLTLTVAPDSDLIFLGAVPVPASTDPNKWEWQLGSLSAGATGVVTLYVRMPAGEVGQRCQLQVVVSSNDIESSPSNNRATVVLQIAHQLVLPILRR